MNTAAFLPCQTSGRRAEMQWLPAWLVLAGLLCIARPMATAVPPEPPAAWQRELDAVRLAEATAALVAARKPDEAIETNRRLDELYRQLTAKYPDRAPVRKAAGDHFWRAGNSPAAVIEWSAAQTLDPVDAETASALGSARLQAGQVRAAREQFQCAVDARPAAARYHFELANVLFTFRHDFVGLPAYADEAGIFSDSLAHFRRASELAAEDDGFARAYAETFYGVPNPDWTEALAAWEHVRSLNPAAQDFAVVHLARISLRLGKPAEAEAYLDAVRDPGFAPVRQTLRRQAEAMRQKAAATPRTP